MSFRTAPREGEWTPVLSFLGAKEIADQFGVSEATIRRWVREGRFPKPARRGLDNAYLWRSWEIDRWTEAQKIRCSA